MVWLAAYIASVFVLALSYLEILPNWLDWIIAVSVIFFIFSVTLIHEHIKKDISDLLPEGSNKVPEGANLGALLVFTGYLYTILYLVSRRSKITDESATELLVEAEEISTDESKPASSDTSTADIELETEPTRQNSEPTASIQQKRGDDTVGGDDAGDTIFCVECGHELQADAKFCTSCGNNLP